MRFITAFVAAMACMEFHAIGMSMQYTWVFVISMSFSIYILKKTQGIKKKLLPAFYTWHSTVILDYLNEGNRE